MRRGAAQGSFREGRIMEEKMMTRRDLVIAVAGVLGVSALQCFESQDAYAVIGSEPIAKTAAQLWAEAEMKARIQGCEVEYGLTPGNSPVPLSRVTGSIQSEMVFLFGQPDYITAYASYEVSSANRITSLYTAGLYGGASSATQLHYNKTILDNGRTMALYYTAVMQNYIGLNQGVSVYAEFGVSGGKAIRVTTM